MPFSQNTNLLYAKGKVFLKETQWHKFYANRIRKLWSFKYMTSAILISILAILKINSGSILISEEYMCRLRNIAMCDYHQSVTSGQTNGQTLDKVIPSCAALLRQRQKMRLYTLSSSIPQINI